MTRAGRGQSAVIGSVLLVAVGVVLAGSVMVYGGSLGSDLADPAQISLDAAQESGASQYESSASLRIEHGGGTELAPSDLSVVVDGKRVANRSNLTLTYSAPSFDVGERLVVEQTARTGFSGGETVTLLYHSGDDSFEHRSFAVEGGGPGADSAVFGFEGSDVGEGPNDPWDSEKSGSPSPTVEVRNSPSASGEKSLYLGSGMSGDGTASTAAASIDLNLTGVAEVRVDYYMQDDARIHVADDTPVDGNNLKSKKASWKTISVDVSNDMDVIEFSLFNKERTKHPGKNSGQVYFDNIRFYDDGGDRIAAEDVLA